MIWIFLRVNTPTVISLSSVLPLMCFKVARDRQRELVRERERENNGNELNRNNAVVDED